MTSEQIEKMTYENAIAIKELSSALKNVTENVDKVATAVDNLSKHDTRITVLESKVDNLQDVKSKLVWGIVTSWLAIIGYSIETIIVK